MGFMKDKDKIIEELAQTICEFNHNIGKCDCVNSFAPNCTWKDMATSIYNAGYRKLTKDSVVLSREEYEKLKSLYDCQHGSIMTSSIGDLPLTIEGLRKAVDEIARLINVQPELKTNARAFAEWLKRENRTLTEYQRRWIAENHFGWQFTWNEEKNEWESKKV